MSLGRLGRSESIAESVLLGNGSEKHDFAGESPFLVKGRCLGLSFSCSGRFLPVFVFLYKAGRFALDDETWAVVHSSACENASD
jgi:hypothetical protein